MANLCGLLSDAKDCSAASAWSPHALRGLRLTDFGAVLLSERDSPSAKSHIPTPVNSNMHLPSMTGSLTLKIAVQFERSSHSPFFS